MERDKLQSMGQGMNEGAGQVALQPLADKLEEAPPDLVERVRRGDTEWRQSLTLLVASARTLEELDLS